MVTVSFAHSGCQCCAILRNCNCEFCTHFDGHELTSDEKSFVFTFKSKKTPEKLEIPYDRINVLEYGQKAGRRLGLAIAISPLALFSKKRKHFLTINYLDDKDK